MTLLGCIQSPPLFQGSHKKKARCIAQRAFGLFKETTGAAGKNTLRPFKANIASPTLFLCLFLFACCLFILGMGLLSSKKGWGRGWFQVPSLGSNHMEY
jgi:hypothetical protein